MTSFLVFIVCAYVELFALLTLWGVSAGPTNAVPFIALLGCLILLLVASPLVMFLPRVGSATAILGSSLVLVWPLSFLMSDAGAALLVLPPAVAIAVAGWALWRTRHQPWLMLASKPRLWLRVALAVVPVGLFCFAFNAPLVLALLLDGPPK